MKYQKKVSRLSLAQLVFKLIQDPERKSLFKIAFEIVYLTLYFKRLPTHYFSRYLFKRDVLNITDYLPGKFLYSIKAKFNDKASRVMLDNKLLFDFYYRQLNFHLPKIWMFNHRQVFVIKESSKLVRNVDDFRNLIAKTINDNSSDLTVFVKKTYGSYQGANIYKIQMSQLDGSSEEMNDLYAKIIESGFLFQETVRQHPQMNLLNSSCLNTLRLDTFKDASGEIHVISAYVKTNIRDHYIDNEPTGACEISVDLVTGKLHARGSLAVKFNGLMRPTKHPLTNIVFEGFRIPFFKEAKELAIEAARVMPGLRLVGWDVAISEEGPILIEGNSDYDIAASDLAYGGYRKNPVFQEVLKEHQSK